MSRYDLPPRQPDAVPDFVRALPEDGRGKLAIFDADGTMWRDDAADDSTHWMMDQGHAKHVEEWPEYLKIYRVDHAAGCRHLLRIFAGMRHADYLAQIQRWWEDHAHRGWVVEVLESLYLLAERGYTIWVVTGSPTDVMTPLLSFLPVDRIVGMDFEVDADGIITGAVSGISCADEGKAEKVRALWGDRPILFAAGNGRLDTWMMELSNGVIWSVYPNEEFHAVSLAKGWHILPRPADFVEEAKLA